MYFTIYREKIIFSSAYLSEIDNSNNVWNIYLIIILLHRDDFFASQGTPHNDDDTLTLFKSNSDFVSEVIRIFWKFQIITECWISWLVRLQSLFHNIPHKIRFTYVYLNRRAGMHLLVSWAVSKQDGRSAGDISSLYINVSNLLNTILSTR